MGKLCAGDDHYDHDHIASKSDKDEKQDRTIMNNIEKYAVP